MIHKLLDLALFLAIALWIWLKRAHIRAINKHSAANVWGLASDTRFARVPSRWRPFAKKKGFN